MRLLVLSFILTCLVSLIVADGYGGYGHTSYQPMMSSGGGGRGRKWSIRARGKGMQNMMPVQHHQPSYKKDYKKHEQEIVYYPVPIYTPHHEEYHHEDKYKESKYKEDDHKVEIIPISMSGGGYGGGYGGGGYGGGGYGGGGGEVDLGSLLKLLSLTKGGGGGGQ